MNIGFPAAETQTHELSAYEKQMYPDSDMRRVEAFNTQGKRIAVVYVRQCRGAIQRNELTNQS